MQANLLPVAVLGLALGVGASASGQSGGATPSPGQPPLRPNNPCVDHKRTPRLRCPDLVIWKPYDRFYTYTGGQVRLQAGNSIVNVGAGPVELLGSRDGPRSMSAVQLIQAVGGRKYRFYTGARLAFKYVPGLGSYWKFRNAARFELWSVGSGNRLLRRVRTGPKQVYCLRDLTKRFWSPFSPRSRHFPGCSQDPDLRGRVLGTSVGWSDDYPATYYEQWINVAGLRGRFAFFQVVDPLNHIHESNESNNRSAIIYLTLPPGSGGGGPSSGGGY